MEEGTREKWEKRKSKKRTEKAKKKKVKREYFPLRCVKRTKDVNTIQAHEQFLKGSAIISTAV